MELWNAYTRAGELTETVLVRGNPIPQGFYHLVCEVLVRHVDGSFLCVIDWDKENVKLQPGETEGYKWLNEKQFTEFIHSDQMIDTQKRRYKNYFLKEGYL